MNSKPFYPAQIKEERKAESSDFYYDRNDFDFNRGNQKESCIACGYYSLFLTSYDGSYS